MSFTNVVRESHVVIPGPDGLLEGKMKLALHSNSPFALIFHPHPLHGGTMNNKIVHNLSRSFQYFQCHTLRINFRGVGNSQGKSIGGTEELDDALAALDWFIKKCERNADSPQIWVAGFSFGGWIAMQAAMRRPEIAGFIAISPPVETYYFNMLTPCPNGLIVQGNNDHIVQANISRDFSEQLIKQKGCEVKFVEINDADHYYTNQLDKLDDTLNEFLERHI